MDTEQQETETKSLSLLVYDEIRQKIAELKEHNATLCFDIHTKEGDKEARAHVASLRKKKADIERTRKALKADALEYGHKVDSIAKELTAEMEEMITLHQEPLDELKAIRDELEKSYQLLLDSLNTSNLVPFTVSSDLSDHIEVVESGFNSGVLNQFSEGQQAILKNDFAIYVKEAEDKLADLKKQEAERAELEQLRREKHEREQKELERKQREEEAERKRLEEIRKAQHEEQLKREAAKEAEEKAERQRQEAERKHQEELKHLEDEKRKAEQQLIDEQERQKRAEEARKEEEAKLQADTEWRTSVEAKLETELSDCIRSLDIVTGHSIAEHIVNQIIAGAFPRLSIDYKKPD